MMMPPIWNHQYPKPICAKGQMVKIIGPTCTGFTGKVTGYDVDETDRSVEVMLINGIRIVAPPCEVEVINE